MALVRSGRGGRALQRTGACARWEGVGASRIASRVRGSPRRARDAVVDHRLPDELALDEDGRELLEVDGVARRVAELGVDVGEAAVEREHVRAARLLREQLLGGRLVHQRRREGEAGVARREAQHAVVQEAREAVGHRDQVRREQPRRQPAVVVAPPARRPTRRRSTSPRSTRRRVRRLSAFWPSAVHVRVSRGRSVSRI